MSYIEGTATITLNQYEIFKKKQEQHWELIEERNGMVELLKDIENTYAVSDMAIRMRLDKILSNYRERELE